MNTKKFCKNGHDVSIFGRNKYGSCYGCARKRQIRYERKNTNRKRDFQWRARGNSCTEELFNELTIKQNNKCAICDKSRDEFRFNLAVDHRHETGKVRGLLCTFCNRVLLPIVEYRFNEIEKAKKYLEETNG